MKTKPLEYHKVSFETVQKVGLEIPKLKAGPTARPEVKGGKTKGLLLVVFIAPVFEACGVLLVKA